MKRLHTAAAVAATSVLGAGAAVAAGRYAAGTALRPSRHHRGRSHVPAGFEGPALTVHATDPGHITLTRSLTSLLPGTYGLAGRHGHAVVGPVVEGPDGQGAAADTVVRALLRTGPGELGPGDRVRLTPQVYSGDPVGALGLASAEADVPGELGTLPAWFVPGGRRTWVIAVHGLGATREQALCVLPFLAERRVPVLVLGYRGDAGAPRPADGVGHLGNTEWRDLDAAIRYAMRYGAERVVLHGWSTGASMALQAAANSALRDRVAGLVLDSPVLDWRATVRALASARHVPKPLLPLVLRAAQGRAGLGTERLATAAEPRRLAVPTLLFHGPADSVAPWQASRDFAAAREDLVTLHTVNGAPHAAMWNADPEKYEEALRRFLTPLV
ncbi:alpha/beta fold hydrolase [Streptomyces sp. HNM0574]|uniref:alpha/beta hydrolase n=1 Tax=Streptomyces sp. HNM0574 TaxID=2714954 RepID=UPI00146E4AFF|nr:alpha/beta fold hydrolase [Streptomyces sp. HNM0574]NLU67438.1 alpha/beta fold hydrolase [Streptomyces sp. HNM0574]